MEGNYQIRSNYQNLKTTIGLDIATITSLPLMLASCPGAIGAANIRSSGIVVGDLKKYVPGSEINNDMHES